jgi:hypothetical protein
MDDLFDDGGLDVEETFAAIEEEITQEDAWIVIDAYFSAKGLVRQQIDSFEDFISNTIQELVDDSGEIILLPEKQYSTNQDIELHGHQIKFGQVHTYIHHTHTPYIHTYIHTPYIHTYIHAYIHTCIHTYIHNIHTYIHNIHTYIHT